MVDWFFHVLFDGMIDSLTREPSLQISHKVRSENNSSPGQGILDVAEQEKARVIIVGEFIAACAFLVC